MIQLTATPAVLPPGLRLPDALQAYLLMRYRPTVMRRLHKQHGALGNLGQRESLDTLTVLLSDGDPRLARLAAESLVQIGPEGISRLGEAASGLSPSARVAGAALYLAGLRGQLPEIAAGV